EVQSQSAGMSRRHTPCAVGEPKVCELCINAVRLCFRITMVVMLVMVHRGPSKAAADERPVPTAALAHLDDEPPPLRLGHRGADELPPLTDEELGTAQQQSLLMALSGDPYLHRADEHACAGCSMLTRSHALCSNTAHYGGYWVGGGVPCRRDKPHADEGTFGW